MYNIETVPTFKIHNVGTPIFYDISFSFNQGILVASLFYYQPSGVWAFAHSMRKVDTRVEKNGTKYRSWHLLSE